MTIEKRLDDILNTKSKVKIIRLFISRTEDFMASGREIAKLTEITPPAAHAALKELYDRDILKREVIGRQHIYKINFSNHTVKDILQPAFQKERSIKADIANFLVERITKYKLTNIVTSVILYGSVARGESHMKSDCDVAVIVKNPVSKKKAEDTFIDNISGEFSAYFGIHLDAYIKTTDEFIRLLRGKRPPVSTMIKSYTMVYGKDLMEYK